MKDDLTDICFIVREVSCSPVCAFILQSTTFSYSLVNVNMSCTFEAVTAFSCVSLCVVNEAHTSDIKLTVKSKKSDKVSLFL